ncbi:MAG: DegV family protein [Trueperaceae bacterium]
MKLGIITDSTCDLRAEELTRLGIERVPLYVNFKGGMHKDWLEINPKDIIEGVAAGAAMPSTSQPSPQDFENAYKKVIDAGADSILCITISSGLSGTFQSANVAKANVNVPVTVFDSRAASIGSGSMVKQAVVMRDSGASLEAIVKALEHIRDTNFVLFTVDTLNFLQKNGRIGRAQALLGGLLNVKPLLSVKEGKVEPVGRARGTKKAIKELVDQIQTYRQTHTGDLVISFLHVQDPPAANVLHEAVKEAGISFKDAGTYEIGAVIATHVGPGTFGMYMHTEPQ